MQGDTGIVREIWEDDLRREDGTKKIKRIAASWNIRQLESFVRDSRIFKIA